MSDPLDWNSWNNLYKQKLAGGNPSLERLGLRNLHSTSSMDFIKSNIEAIYLKKNIVSEAQISSIWVDGTPQAKFFDIKGSQLNCELADLLFILKEEDARGIVREYRAVLLQGKCSDYFDKLPSGPSTKIERQLFEQLDRNRNLLLYRNTKATGTPIGSYLLGNSISGLDDCARYLMMPNVNYWHGIPQIKMGPYVVGWPDMVTSDRLSDATNYLDAILIGMIEHKNVGREILLDANLDIDQTCGWSRMIYDLLKGYTPKVMRGYGKQRRVYTSSKVTTKTPLSYPIIRNWTIKYDNVGKFSSISNTKPPITFFDNGQSIQWGEPIIPTIFAHVKTERNFD